MSWLDGWWPSSLKHLEKAEDNILSHVRSPCNKRFVEVDGHQIWTVSFNEHSTNLPLVLIHGFATGVATWAINYDALAADRPVYAFDVLGFGRSSRPPFSSDPLVGEQQMVDSIEAWREAMRLERFVLLGHSFGGFLATSYAVLHPGRVEHLVLLDPWGIQEHRRLPAWDTCSIGDFLPFNPLFTLRVIGPLGPKVLEKLLAYVCRKYSELGCEPTAFAQYTYHINAQKPASGEVAFKHMAGNYLKGWAKHPMIRRMKPLCARVPMTFIYGTSSFIDPEPAYQLQTEFGEKHITVHEIEGCGHLIYVYHSDLFNNMVKDICKKCDEFNER